MLQKMTQVIRGTLSSFLKRPRYSQQKNEGSATRVVRSHNLVVKKFSIDDYLDRKYIQQLIQNLRAFKDSLAVSGQKDGSLGIPSSDTLLPSSAETEFSAKCATVKKQVLSMIALAKSKTSTLVKNALRNRDEYSREERISYYLSQHSTEMDKKIKRTTKGLSSRQNLQQQIKQLEAEISQATAELNDLIKNTYFQKRVVKKLVDISSIYILLLVAITLGEFPLNITALQQLGEFSNAFVLLLSGSFALIMGFSAHATGHTFFKRRKWDGLLAFGLGISACVLVSILRIPLQGSLVMSFMNVLVFLFGCYLSYERAKNLTYWTTERRIRKLKRKKAHKQSILEKVVHSYRADAEREVRAQLDDLQYYIDCGESVLSQFEAYEHSVLNQIDAIHQEGLAVYINANALARVKSGHQPVSLWEQRTTVKEHTGNGQPFTIPRFASIIVLLIGLSSLLGCQSSTSNDAVLLFDATEPQVNADYPPEKIADYLLQDVLNLDDGDLLSNGVKVTISSIGATSIRYTQTVELPQGGSFLSRTEKTRMETIDRFKADLQTQIGQISKTENGLKQTALLQNLCEQFNRLANAKGQRKEVLIFSDMIQNTPEVSFYQFRNNPSQLLAYYEKIASKMDQICGPHRLDNITITVIYLPTQKTDRLFQAVKAFWSKYLSERGARVVFIPNI